MKPSLQLSLGLLCVLFTACQAPRIQTIVIHSSEDGYRPCEPSIVIDPTDKDHIVAGSIMDYYHVSHDGGLTWTTGQLTSPHGVFGDPVLAADADGRIYYAHLADPEKKGWSSERLLDGIVVQYTDDHGSNWSDGVVVGSRHPKDQDKEWLGVHPTLPKIAMTWTEFDLYNDPSPDCQTRIRYAGSNDAGVTWSTPMTISSRQGNCLDDDETVEGAVPVIDRSGHVSVAWAGHHQIYFNRSVDGGTSWLPEARVIADQEAGWSQPIPGMKRVNGMPITVIDQSGGPHDGRLYVLFADQKTSGQASDIYLILSDDDGRTWTAPRCIHPDQREGHQWSPWMNIDATTGYLYTVYYDRAGLGEEANHVALAYSTDGGQTWSRRRITEQPFKTPPEELFFGDYNHISAVGGQIRPIWTSYDGGTKLSVRTAIINHQRLGIKGPKRPRP